MGEVRLLEKVQLVEEVQVVEVVQVGEVVPFGDTTSGAGAQGQLSTLLGKSSFQPLLFPFL